MLACACVAMTACGEHGGAGAAPGGPPGGAPPPMPVTVVEARPVKVPLTVEAVGQTEGSREVGSARA
jgi:membrane fusion protein (multidrug efflux system)